MSLKILFAGTPENSAMMLKKLYDYAHNNNDVQIVGVLTREDARVGRKSILMQSPVAAMADELGLVVIKANSLNNGVLSSISSLNADVALVVAYGVLLHQEAICLLDYGWINVHYSLLPWYRGASPVQASIAAGDDITGVTFFQIDVGLDTGPVLFQKDTVIDPDETADDLLLRLTQLASGEIGNFFQEILEAQNSHSALALSPQKALENSSVASKISNLDARVDWNQPHNIVYDKIRAMTSQPGAWTILETDNGVQLRIKFGQNARVGESDIDVEGTSPGTLIWHNKKLYITTKNGAIEICQLQPSGKSMMSVSKWFAGISGSGMQLSQYHCL